MTAASTPILDEQLRALIAKWRADWRTDTVGSSDRDSGIAGCAIEECADELEEILNSTPTVQAVPPAHIQCLLLSGLGHGKLLMVEGCVRAIQLADPEGRSATQLYIVENHVHDQKTYRIATHNATPWHFAQLPSMIRDTGLLPIAL